MERPEKYDLVTRYFRIHYTTIIFVQKITAHYGVFHTRKSKKVNENPV